MSQPAIDLRGASPFGVALLMAGGPLQRLFAHGLRSALLHNKAFQEKDSAKQHKIALHLQKAITYTILWTSMACMSKDFFGSFGELPMWMLDKLGPLGFVFAILPTLYSFELVFSNCTWDEWLHHCATIAIGILNGTSNSLLPFSDSAALAAWCYAIVWATSCNWTFGYVFSLYHLSSNARTKQRLASTALAITFVKALLIDGAALAALVAHRRFFSSQPLEIVLWVFPFAIIPAQVLPLKTLYSIRKMNAERRKATVTQLEGIAVDSETSSHAQTSSSSETEVVPQVAPLGAPKLRAELSVAVGHELSLAFVHHPEATPGTSQLSQLKELEAIAVRPSSSSSWNGEQ